MTDTVDMLTEAYSAAVIQGKQALYVHPHNESLAFSTYGPVTFDQWDALNQSWGVQVEAYSVRLRAMDAIANGTFDLENYRVW